MNIVYIAGPYTGKTYEEVDRHIVAARDAAASLAKAGVGFLCPHMNSAHFEVITPDVGADYWYELGLELLAACDALYLLPGWQDSVGSRKERDHALKTGIPVFDDLNAVIRWMFRRGCIVCEGGHHLWVDNMDSCRCCGAVQPPHTSEYPSTYPLA